LLDQEYGDGNGNKFVPMAFVRGGTMITDVNILLESLLNYPLEG